MSETHPDFSSEQMAPLAPLGGRIDPIVSKEDVRRIRKHYLESQAQFAKRLEVDAVTVARWETGQRRCTGQFANRVALLDPEGNTVVRRFLTESSSLLNLTNRALKAVLLAQSEAHRFGSTWVGSEHLLLGLIGEGKGTAAFCCRLNNIKFQHVAIEVEALNGWGKNTIILEQPLSDRVQSMLELPSAQARFHALNFGIPCSPKFEELLARTTRLAKTRNDDCIGTGHLLITLLNMEKCAATEVLTGMGIDSLRITESVERLMQKPEGIQDTLPELNESIDKRAKSNRQSVSESIEAAADCLQEASRNAFMWQDYNLAFWIRDCEINLRRKLLQSPGSQFENQT